MEKRAKETLVKDAGILTVEDAEKRIEMVAFSEGTASFKGADSRTFLGNKDSSTIAILGEKSSGTFFIVEPEKFDQKFNNKKIEELLKFRSIGLDESSLEFKGQGGINALYPNLSKGPAPELVTPIKPNQGGLQFFEDQPKEKPPIPSASSPRQAGGLQFYEDLHPEPPEPKHKI